MKKDSSQGNLDRRNFLKIGLLTGAATTAVIGSKSIFAEDSGDSAGSEKVKVETADGKVMEVDSNMVHHPAEESAEKMSVRNAVPGRKFVMVIDLARCANERACVEGCQKMHNTLPPIEYLKVKRMQDSELGAPYWMPVACMQCDNPPCTKVCPVDATFKRTDGIVAIDSERCIGCKFCMAACPYSARSFNFGRPEQVEYSTKNECGESNCCSTKNYMVGTVSKCDFCTEHASKGELPSCVTECPNGTIFYGDELEDAVTNGEETFRLSDLLRKRAGYRLFEELGTKPRIYYLPPVNRQFPFAEAEGPVNTQE